MSLCPILVLMRCYCKLVLVKKFTADDYFSVLALVSLVI
jgi:hypothetical protein